MHTNIKPPVFNQVPFLKLKVPKDLYSQIQKEYSNMIFQEKDLSYTYEPEYKKFICSGITIKGIERPYCYAHSISQELYNKCYEVLTPMIEEWCQVKLEKTWGYGIRSYVKNSILHLHRDRPETHIISCIIYVDQKSELNWPLDFYDHQNEHHQVFFDDGDMLFYESLCVHGRETSFRGQYYRNMYFHWKPVDWDEEKYKYDLKLSFANGTKLLNYYR
jgi:prolyl 4-hydroxylase